MIRAWSILLAVVALVAALVLLRSEPDPLPPARPYASGTAMPAGRVKPKVVYQNGCGLFVAPDGTLWTWGGGFHAWGYHPDVRPWPSTVPRQFGDSTHWIDAAVGGHHGVGIQDDGSLWVWGTGAGTTPVGNPAGSPPGEFRRPVRVGTETNWIAVAAGAGHGVALKRDGTVWCWGQNSYGEIGDPTSGGGRSQPTQSMGTGYVRIAAGAFATFAQRSDGSVWGWGSSGSGTTNSVPGPIGGEKAVWRHFGAGAFHFAGIREDGSLQVGGGNSHLITGEAPQKSMYDTVQLGTETDWVEVLTGGDHLLARRADGSWWGFGPSQDGQLGIGGPVGVGIPSARPSRVLLHGPVLSADAAIDATVVLAPDGVLWTWGVRPGPQPRYAWYWGGFGESIRQFADRLGLPPWAAPRVRPPQIWHEPRPIWRWPESSNPDR